VSVSGVTKASMSWFYTAIVTLVWATLAAVVGTVVWAFLGFGVSLTGSGGASWKIATFLAGLVYGGVVALLALPGYWILLIGYAALFARWPSLERATWRFVLVALLLASPLALVVFLSFLDPWGPFGPHWGRAAVAGPFAFISAWVGIALPRIVIPSLRPGQWWVAT